MNEDDDGRRYADYLLELQDDLDVAESRPTGWRMSVGCLVGAVLAVGILTPFDGPILILAFVAALFGGAPLAYLFLSYRFKAQERAAILKRIEQIESRRMQIDAIRAQSFLSGPHDGQALDEHDTT